MFLIVRRARRRLFCNELLAQGANTVSAAMAAFILLLLFGTQILNLEWLVTIPVAAVAAGFYLARRKLPSPYQIAQLIDHRLRLSDAISTALYFERKSGPVSPSESIRKAQYEAARRLSETLDARQAVPYIVPRTAYLMLALVLVASSLFALRYGLSRKLDLRPPLARILQQSFGFSGRTKEAKTPRRTLPPMVPNEMSEDPGLDTEEAVAQEPEAPSQPSPESKGTKGDQQKGGENQPKAQNDAERSASDDPSDKSGDPAGNDASAESSKAAPNGSKQNSANHPDTNAENSSLLSKVKDAMQNLISRMKPQPNQGSGQQSAMEQNGKQSSGQQNGSKQQSAKNGQQQANGQQSGEQQGESGDQAENSQDSQGKGTGKNNSEQASKQPGSGVGSENGDKSIKQAQQLAAMGKISEIIGKRAANISGETTVEVQNTNQVLRTSYAQRTAQHSQGGAEINRDEVPVALQSYVEQYFEQVRRPAPPANK